MPLELLVVLAAMALLQALVALALPMLVAVAVVILMLVQLLLEQAMDNIITVQHLMVVYQHLDLI